MQGAPSPVSGAHSSGPSGSRRRSTQQLAAAAAAAHQLNSSAAAADAAAQMSYLVAAASAAPPPSRKRRAGSAAQWEGDDRWRDVFAAPLVATAAPGARIPGLEAYRMGEYQVLVASTLAAADAAMVAWQRDKQDHVVGLDFEWSPERAKGQNNPIALVQLSAHRTVVLLRTSLLGFRLPHSVQQLLVDPSTQLAVCGWSQSDAHKYQSTFVAHGQGPQEILAQLCEVQTLARGAGIGQVGLKGLVQSLLHPAFNKNKKATMYSWGSPRQLPPLQIRYAALDAICTEHVYRVLLTLPQRPPRMQAAPGKAKRPATTAACQQKKQALPAAPPSSR